LHYDEIEQQRCFGVGEDAAVRPKARLGVMLDVATRHSLEKTKRW